MDNQYTAQTQNYNWNVEYAWETLRRILDFDFDIIICSTYYL